MAIVHEIKCSHCGAPLSFDPGEIVATCKYCGYTTVIETGKAFTLEHSMLLNKYDPIQIEEVAKSWMQSGFLKPPDLARKSKVIEKSLIYIPFWIVTAEAETTYKGVFERVTPAVVKDGQIKKKYNWLILARKATEFPTREYDVPLEGKVTYDFRKIENHAKTLNSEIDRDEALEKAKEEIEEHHKYLVQQDVDKIIEIKNEINVSQAVYLHAPIWFIKYEYKGKTYQLMIDGASGTVVKGDIPSGGFGIL